MTLARTWAVTVTGVEGRLVEVEADLGQGLPSCAIVGLPDAALSESRDRVRAAVQNSRITWPSRRITVGLSPASLPKRGSGFDLAVAVAILAGAGEVPVDAIAGTVFLGELGLDGRARPVRGVLPAALTAVGFGRGRLVCPAANAAEAALVEGLDVVPVSSLGQLVAVLRGDADCDDLPPPAAADDPADARDLADVVGQHEGRRALEVCAAGGHHVLLHGPPGAGKTMLAERLPGLLPALDRPAALEVTSVHSVAGRLQAGAPLVTRPPFVAPHHTATVAAMVGGGSGLARPGAVSLAHHGVLFMDEAPEFEPRVLEALREPLESGEVSISRSAFHTVFPARVQLVLAANPCPCGASPESGGRADLASAALSCRCTPNQRRRYAARLSGPLVDRVDVSVLVDRVDRVALLGLGDGAETSAVVADRVAAARQRAADRWRAAGWTTNAAVPGPSLRSVARPHEAALGLLDDALRKGRLSARGVHKVMRVAWSVCDLRGGERPGVEDVREALGLRSGGLWAAA